MDTDATQFFIGVYGTEYRVWRNDADTTTISNYQYRQWVSIYMYIKKRENKREKKKERIHN